MQNLVIERVHRTGKKNKDRLRSIVAQFSFYKGRMNTLKNCKDSSWNWKDSWEVYEHVDTWLTKFQILEEFRR